MRKYSFVIPAYNYKEYLVNCLESLNHQIGFGAEDYEVVVVDDGSNDGTRDIIEKMDFSFPLNYIYIERTEKSCRNVARNTGWRNAGGEIIIFLDADMILQKDFLRNLEMCYEMSHEIFVVGLRFMLHESVSHDQIKDGSVFSRLGSTQKPDIKYLEERHFLFHKISYNTASFHNPWIYFYSCNVSVPKKYLLLTGGFNEKLHGWGFDDQELGYRLFNAGLRMIINQKLEGLHQFHGEVYGVSPSTQRVLEWHRNIHHAYKLNKDIRKQIPKLKLIVCYALKKITWMNRINHKVLQKHRIQIKNKNQIEACKETVKALAAAKKNEIMVYDHVEDSDLHIWIQFLGRTESIVKYFPASRVMSEDSIKKYEKYLKKTYPKVRAIYLIKMAYKAFIHA
ncbi:MAG: glycosyltransferase family 2 protein [Firmicutes bacterium]|nr:glycosyltransferase family 2 protein [Bacillota bacterium]